VRGPMKTQGVVKVDRRFRADGFWEP